MSIPVSLWWRALRPKTLPAAVAPVVIGSVVAHGDGGFYGPAAALAAVGALFLQIGSNFANDYFDFINGIDTANRVGPQRMTRELSPATMKRAFISVFTLAALCGIGLLVVAGWPVVVIGISAIAAGTLYTGGPKPYGYMGLGEFFVFIFFGLVAVAGTYYVQVLCITEAVVIAGMGPGFLSIAMLAINNLRDLETDRCTHKRTLAVLCGESFARMEIILAIFCATAIPIWLAFSFSRPWLVMAAAFTIVAAIPLVIQPVMNGFKGRLLNDVLAGSGNLLLVYTILFSIGWLFS